MGLGKNVSEWERIASIAAGAAMLAYEARRARGASVSPAMATAATGLIARGISGYCPVNALVGRNSSASDTREALGGSGGVHVVESITIARPIEDVYRFWRQLSNLPRFMSHLKDVEVLSGTRSRWTARGPAGTTVSWDAEIINEVPGEVIGWRSLDDADVISAGSVHFRTAPHGGTEVRVRLQYEPPAGKLGAWVASLFGEEPSQQIREDLRRLKAYFETGEMPVARDRMAPASAFPAYPTPQGHMAPFNSGAVEEYI